MQCIEHREKAFARHGEHPVAALQDKLVDKDLAAAAEGGAVHRSTPNRLRSAAKDGYSAFLGRPIDPIRGLEQEFTHLRRLASQCMHQVTAIFDRLLGIAGDGPRDLALIEERLAVLQPRMPWVYAMTLSCLIGQLFTFGLAGHPPTFTLIVGVLSALRGVMWLWLRRQHLVGEPARRRLRSIGLGSIVGNLAFVAIIAQISAALSPERAQLMWLMTATCAIAFSAPMTILPRIALAHLLFFGLPASFLGTLLGPHRDTSVACFNLLLCNLILISLLRLQDRAFVGQLEARLDGQHERARAEHAERIAIEERTVARAMAESDFLTGLANRRAFLAALQASAALPGEHSVLLLDLDGFKPVNDTFGHDVGDILLKEVAARLKVPDIVAARLGGDEFAVLLADTSGAAAHGRARAIVALLSQPYRIGEALVSVSACCGIGTLIAGQQDISGVLREADLALYRAKATGRASVELYSDEMGADLTRRAQIESALRVPGVEHDIELLYQPIFDLRTMRIVSFEALARWTHSQLGPIAPSDFIPITEQMQLVEPISQALLRRAATTALQWTSDLLLSFNLSAVQLCSWGSAQRILKVLDEVGLHPSRLQIEVTETAMMADFETARHNLDTLQQRGVEVVLDDFGAGYASISYLREMVFDKLKLDGSLITASASADGARLLKGVIDLAHAVGIPCIAEHVETGEQAEYLMMIECGYGQGYHLGRPIPADEALILAQASALVTSPAVSPLRKTA